jgi:hypothetical protein
MARPAAPAAPREPSTGGGAPARPAGAPPQMPPRPAAPPAAPRVMPVPSTPPHPGSMAVTSPSLPTVPGTPGERRPINPFLANDPNQKAKRLARALVSDILAYHPGKREEGLANGTLKQIFREEIKKSYEEYVEQIGKEFAESTSHFQDALNELLANGKKLF